MNYELTIDSLAYKGAGVGRADGKVWFVPFTAPGDRIAARPEKEKKSYVRGSLVEILSPSAFRINPGCPHFSRCGGCNWQFLPYSMQLETKAEILKEFFIKGGFTLPHDTHIKPAPEEWNYRNRIQMRLTPGGIPGFYRQGTREVIPVADCPLAENEINREILRLTELAKQKPGGLSGLYPDGFEIRLNRDGSTEILSLNSRNDNSHDFSQINSRVNKILQDEVSGCLDLIRGKRSDLGILDLFCGDGNLSLPLKDISSSIEGWDASVQAVERGNYRAARIGEKTIKYHPETLERGKKQIEKAARKTDAVIVDPPRRGIKGLENFIGNLNVPNLIYISCSPPSMIRDLKALTEFGYKISKTVLLDMFPQTYHIETLVLLTK